MYYQIKNRESSSINEWGEKDIRVETYPEFILDESEIKLVQKFLKPCLGLMVDPGRDELLADIEFFLEQAKRDMK